MTPDEKLKEICDKHEVTPTRLNEMIEVLVINGFQSGYKTLLLLRALTEYTEWTRECYEAQLKAEKN